MKLSAQTKRHLSKALKEDTSKGVDPLEPDADDRLPIRPKPKKKVRVK